ncbi:MAG: hypothetical protein AAF546_00060 [Verrucomicrobiota bacterium]
MNIQDRIEIANQIKAAATEIKPEAGRSIRIWSKGDHVRLYTDGAGYREVLEDGSVNSYKTQGWGHIISEAAEAIQVAY